MSAATTNETRPDSYGDEPGRTASGSPTTAVVPQVSIVVPTRNERDNVGPLLHRLHAALGGTPAEVVFVDDSDDDTPEVVRETAGAYEGTATEVALVHRTRDERAGGLSGAVVSGFRAARAPWVVVMDADLQHPPEVVPDLLAAAVEGAADLVVGSRYVGDGDADGLSSWTRSLVSLGSGRLSKAFFPRRLKDISDPMSGLFLVRRAALDLD
ncbi:MAG TPA: glycosyltransferase, partial [Phytomonospora sp.]